MTNISHFWVHQSNRNEWNCCIEWDDSISSSLINQQMGKSCSLLLKLDVIVCITTGAIFDDGVHDSWGGGGGGGGGERCRLRHSSSLVRLEPHRVYIEQITRSRLMRGGIASERPKKMEETAFIENHPSPELSQSMTSSAARTATFKVR